MCVRLLLLWFTIILNSILGAKPSQFVAHVPGLAAHKVEKLDRMLLIRKMQEKLCRNMYLREVSSWASDGADSLVAEK